MVKSRAQAVQAAGRRAFSGATDGVPRPCPSAPYATDIAAQLQRSGHAGGKQAVPANRWPAQGCKMRRRVPLVRFSWARQAVRQDADAQGTGVLTALGCVLARGRAAVVVTT